MRRLLLVCVAGALAACGGGGDGGGGGGGGTTAVTVTGPLATQANNASAAMGTAACSGLAANYILIGASTYPELCSLSQTGDEKGNATIVSIAVVTFSATGSPAPITAGTYALGTTATQSVSAFVSRNDASCNETDESGDSGTVTISSISNGTVSGSLDVSITGGRITGTFAGAPCAVAGITDVCSRSGVPHTDVCRP
ncbi:MAG TPA: hypothetical protein VFK85_12540 [Anaeromyxobacteraceae bacterium]|nr:hypothetical protein [Anaeromyxobacteraceae bacterium]